MTMRVAWTFLAVAVMAGCGGAQNNGASGSGGVGHPMGGAGPGVGGMTGTGGVRTGTGGAIGMGGAQAGTGGVQTGTGGSFAGTGGSSDGSGGALGGTGGQGGGADGGSSRRVCLAYSEYVPSWTTCSQTISGSVTQYGYLDNYACATCVGHDTTLPDCFPANVPTLCVASCQECAFQ